MSTSLLIAHHILRVASGPDNLILPLHLPSQFPSFKCSLRLASHQKLVGLASHCRAAHSESWRVQTMGDSTVPLDIEAVTSSIRKCREDDGVVIVDHGSRRAQSNSMLHAFVEMYKQKTGHAIVEPAHMELANPTITEAFDRCVLQGASRVIITPYFLFPGRHWDKDIPALAAAAAKMHPTIPYIVTAPIGLHELMVKVVQDRIGYCLSKVAGDVSECEMCVGTGRCQVLQADQSSEQNGFLHVPKETS